MTNKKPVKSNGLSNKQSVGIGLGITAAVAAAAAGSYLLYGSKNATKNRKAVKGWALKAKSEVLKGVDRAKELSQEDYEQLVESAVNTYNAAKSASKTELADFKKDMRAHWKGLQKTAAVKKLTAKKAVKKATKKTVRRVAK